ncbi:non-hydrolyzing UDP-N-acetylglucosamine 2-epimerase [Paenibacillus aquistagni]|uniref:UDP-N-acetylglucosamine 2-epimerase (Non-hydrolysing) n=1 Tax=Paenibacillus aquistagni TaxID=1852522 RepID=A0A1X7LTL8_9BACL|nr:UDP-N-acetylglucosamine 2-epimerase (non-hydrolyzing) [Paenibacillus aquistagni]SMG56663.1 UDP-N-acetylglucosamine 2-epimerase (non-hydrolysing) [Paenibacillus aquistagni]
MKIMTVVGTRPEIIRLSLIIKLLDQWADQHILVHTGQNFAPTLSDIFFEELELRKPDYMLQLKERTLGGQLGMMFCSIEQICLTEKPDKVLLLGDTNSALCALLIERMGIPVVHMEAGNRCYDLSVPEEKNRRVIDAIASINMPYTINSKRNLEREGIPSHKIILTGNPIYEVMNHYKSKIDHSTILELLKLEPQSYFIVTTHRAENVDDPNRLAHILAGFHGIAERLQKRLILSVHPRTKDKIKELSFKLHPLVECYEPFGFFDFVQLEKHAYGAITDSGTVQEECCILRVPTVTIRHSTERPETVDCGSNVIAGLNPSQIVSAAVVMTEGKREWSCPEGYEAAHVSSIVAKFLLGGKTDV